MQKHTQQRQPWDWRGQLIQLGLIILVAAVSGAVAYAAATAVAFLTTGGPLPVSTGWQNMAVKIVGFGVLLSLIFLGFKRVNSYLRRTRGRMI